MALDQQNIGSRKYRIPRNGILNSKKFWNNLKINLLCILRFKYKDTGFVDVLDSPEFLVWEFEGTGGTLTVEDTDEGVYQDDFSYDNLTGHVLRDTTSTQIKSKC